MPTNDYGSSLDAHLGSADRLPDYLFDITDSERPLCDAAADVLRTVRAATGWDAGETLRFVAAAVDGPGSPCCGSAMVPSWSAQDGAYDLIVYECPRCGFERDILADRLTHDGRSGPVRSSP